MCACVSVCIDIYKWILDIACLICDGLCCVVVIVCLVGVFACLLVFLLWLHPFAIGFVSALPIPCGFCIWHCVGLPRRLSWGTLQLRSSICAGQGY